MNYLEHAEKILDELIEYRRTLHRHPEIGFDLPKTAAFVSEKLTEFGYQPEIIGENGVTATVGTGEGKVILLRCDMDALPIKEQSGEEFSSENEYMHACGHDYHTTLLLGAAKLLKENEANLKGTVKLLFQPAEELLVGGQAMVDAGILENPKVDAAMAVHVQTTLEKGVYLRKGVSAASANNFRITIHGDGAHGAMPSNGIDPVNIGAHIVVRAQAILARELPIDKPIVLTMGKFIADGAVNVIPSDAVIEGTLRTFNTEAQEFAKKRLVEIVQETAAVFRGSAELEFLCDVPVLDSEPALVDAFYDYITPVAEAGEFGIHEVGQASGSEDFAHITAHVPSVHFNLGAAYPGADVHYNLHHPKVRFDEQQIPIGAAVFAEYATRWLKDN